VHIPDNAIITSRIVWSLTVSRLCKSQASPSGANRRAHQGHAADTSSALQFVDRLVSTARGSLVILKFRVIPASGYIAHLRRQDRRSRAAQTPLPRTETETRHRRAPARWESSPADSKAVQIFVALFFARNKFLDFCRRSTAWLRIRTAPEFQPAASDPAVWKPQRSSCSSLIGARGPAR